MVHPHILYNLSLPGAQLSSEAKHALRLVRLDATALICDHSDAYIVGDNSPAIPIIWFEGDW